MKKTSLTVALALCVIVVAVLVDIYAKRSRTRDGGQTSSQSTNTPVTLEGHADIQFPERQ